MEESGESEVAHSYEHDSTPGTIAYMVYQGIIFLAGAIGNGMIMTAILRSKHLRTEVNVFTFNLCCADSIVVFISAFNLAAAHLGAAWFLDHWPLCVFIGTVCLVGCICSLLSIMMVAINRYFLICRPAIYKAWFGFRRNVVYCAVLWLVAVLLQLPNHVGWGGIFYDPKIKTCVYNRLASYSFTITWIIVAAIIPATIIAGCYWKVYRHVVGSAKALRSGYDSKEAQAAAATKLAGDRRHLALAKTLFIVFVAFVLFWLPYVLLIVFDLYDKVPAGVYTFAACLVHTNSAINALLYGASNAQFRRAFRHQTTACCPGTSACCAVTSAARVSPQTTEVQSTAAVTMTSHS